MLNLIKPSYVQNIINKFCYTIGMIPSSYKLSLTYEEQILAIGKYLEDTVYPAINNNAQAVAELQNLFLQLHDYVNNYFDNLDVQNEINNKLDEMANSGELTNIIAQYVQLSAIFSFNTLDDLLNSTDLVEGSTARTLGDNLLNDLKGATFKIVKLKCHIPDNLNTYSLNRDDLYAQRIYENKVVVFDNINDLKSSNVLTKFDFIKTLGYFNLNDGGQSFYYITDNELVPNDKNIIALKNNLFAVLINNTPYLNIKQFGANENDTPDTVIFIDALNYCRQNNLILQLNNKTYNIDNSIEIDIASDKIEGNNAKINFNGSTLFTFKNSNSLPYYNVHNVFKDLFIEFTGENKENTICFDFQNENSEISHISLNTINIKGFDTAINIFTNAYHIIFDKVEAFSCENCVKMLSGATNYGENIAFNCCCFYNSTNALINNNPNGTLSLTNSSVDYNIIATQTSGNARIFMTNCHLEGKQRFIGNAYISSSEIVFLTLDSGTLFETYQYSNLTFNCCKINGQNQGGTLVTNDEGIVSFIYCTFGNLNGILAPQNTLNNKSLALMTNYPFVYTRGTADNTDYHTATNATVTQTDNVTQFTKIYGGGSESKLYIVIPLDKSKKRISGTFDMKSSQTGNMFVSHIFGKDLSWNGKNVNIQKNMTIGSVTVNLSDYAQTKTFDFTINGYEYSLNDDVFVMAFNFDNASQGYTDISNLKIQMI